MNLGKKTGALAYIKSKLIQIDAYGCTFNLKVKGEDKYKTPLGGILTLLCICCSFSYLIYLVTVQIIDQKELK